MLKRESRFLTHLVNRLEVENLKVVLRAPHQHLDTVQAARWLLPLQAVSSMNFKDLLRQETIDALGPLCGDHP